MQQIVFNVYSTCTTRFFNVVVQLRILKCKFLTKNSQRLTSTPYKDVLANSWFKFFFPCKITFSMEESRSIKQWSDNFNIKPSGKNVGFCPARRSSQRNEIYSRTQQIIRIPTICTKNRPTQKSTHDFLVDEFSEMMKFYSAEWQKDRQ